MFTTPIIKPGVIKFDTVNDLKVVTGGSTLAMGTTLRKSNELQIDRHSLCRLPLPYLRDSCVPFAIGKHLSSDIMLLKISHGDVLTCSRVAAYLRNTFGVEPMLTLSILDNKILNTLKSQHSILNSTSSISSPETLLIFRAPHISSIRNLMKTHIPIDLPRILGKEAALSASFSPDIPSVTVMTAITELLPPRVECWVAAIVLNQGEDSQTVFFDSLLSKGATILFKAVIPKLFSLSSLHDKLLAQSSFKGQSMTGVSSGWQKSFIDPSRFQNATKNNGTTTNIHNKNGSSFLYTTGLNSSPPMDVAVAVFWLSTVGMQPETVRTVRGKAANVSPFPEFASRKTSILPNRGDLPTVCLPASSFISSTSFDGLSIHPQLESVCRNALLSIGEIPAIGQNETEASNEEQPKNPTADESGDQVDTARNARNRRASLPADVGSSVCDLETSLVVIFGPAVQLGLSRLISHMLHANQFALLEQFLIFPKKEEVEDILGMSSQSQRQEETSRLCELVEKLHDKSEAQVFLGSQAWKLQTFASVFGADFPDELKRHVDTANSLAVSRTIASLGASLETALGRDVSLQDMLTGKGNTNAAQKTPRLKFDSNGQIGSQALSAFANHITHLPCQIFVVRRKSATMLLQHLLYGNRDTTYDVSATPQGQLFAAQFAETGTPVSCYSLSTKEPHPHPWPFMQPGDSSLPLLPSLHSLLKPPSSDDPLHAADVRAANSLSSLLGLPSFATAPQTPHVPLLAACTTSSEQVMTLLSSWRPHLAQPTDLTVLLIEPPPTFLRTFARRGLQFAKKLFPPESEDYMRADILDKDYSMCLSFEEKMDAPSVAERMRQLAIPELMQQLRTLGFKVKDSGVSVAKVDDAARSLPAIIRCMSRLQLSLEKFFFPHGTQPPPGTTDEELSALLPPSISHFPIGFAVLLVSGCGAESLARSLEVIVSDAIEDSCEPNCCGSLYHLASLMQSGQVGFALLPEERETLIARSLPHRSLILEEHFGSRGTLLPFLASLSPPAQTAQQHNAKLMQITNRDHAETATMFSQVSLVSRLEHPLPRLLSSPYIVRFPTAMRPLLRRIMQACRDTVPPEWAVRTVRGTAPFEFLFFGQDPLVPHAFSPASQTPANSLLSSTKTRLNRILKAGGGAPNGKTSTLELIALKHQSENSIPEDVQGSASLSIMQQQQVLVALDVTLLPAPSPPSFLLSQEAPLPTEADQWILLQEEASLQRRQVFFQMRATRIGLRERTKRRLVFHLDPHVSLFAAPPPGLARRPLNDSNAEMAKNGQASKSGRTFSSYDWVDQPLSPSIPLFSSDVSISPVAPSPVEKQVLFGVRVSSFSPSDCIIGEEGPNLITCQSIDGWIIDAVSTALSAKRNVAHRFDENKTFGANFSSDLGSPVRTFASSSAKEKKNGFAYLSAVSTPALVIGSTLGRIVESLDNYPIDSRRDSIGVRNICREVHKRVRIPGEEALGGSFLDLITTESCQPSESEAVATILLQQGGDAADVEMRSQHSMKVLHDQVFDAVLEGLCPTDESNVASRFIPSEQRFAVSLSPLVNNINIRIPLKIARRVTSERLYLTGMRTFEFADSFANLLSRCKQPPAFIRTMTDLYIGLLGVRVAFLHLHDSAWQNMSLQHPEWESQLNRAAQELTELDWLNEERVNQFIEDANVGFMQNLSLREDEEGGYLTVSTSEIDAAVKLANSQSNLKDSAEIQTFRILMSSRIMQAFLTANSRDAPLSPTLPPWDPDLDEPAQSISESVGTFGNNFKAFQASLLPLCAANVRVSMSDADSAPQFIFDGITACRSSQGRFAAQVSLMLSFGLTGSLGTPAPLSVTEFAEKLANPFDTHPRNFYSAYEIRRHMSRHKSSQMRTAREVAAEEKGALMKITRKALISGFMRSFAEVPSVDAHLLGPKKTEEQAAKEAETLLSIEIHSMFALLETAASSLCLLPDVAHNPMKDWISFERIVEELSVSCSRVSRMLVAVENLRTSHETSHDKLRTATDLDLHRQLAADPAVRLWVERIEVIFGHLRTEEQLVRDSIMHQTGVVGEDEFENYQHDNSQLLNQRDTSTIHSGRPDQTQLAASGKTVFSTMSPIRDYAEGVGEVTVARLPPDPLHITNMPSLMVFQNQTSSAAVQRRESIDTTSALRFSSEGLNPFETMNATEKLLHEDLLVDPVLSPKEEHMMRSLATKNGRMNAMEPSPAGSDSDFDDCCSDVNERILTTEFHQNLGNQTQESAQILKRISKDSTAAMHPSEQNANLTRQAPTSNDLGYLLNDPTSSAMASQHKANSIRPFNTFADTSSSSRVPPETRLEEEISRLLVRDQVAGHNLFDPPPAAQYDLRRSRVSMATEHPLGNRPCSPHVLGAYEGGAAARLLQRDQSPVLMHSVHSSGMDEFGGSWWGAGETANRLNQHLIGVASPMAVSSPAMSIPSEGLKRNWATNHLVHDRRLHANSPEHVGISQIGKPMPPHRPDRNGLLTKARHQTNANYGDFAVSSMDSTSPLHNLLSSSRVASPDVKWSGHTNGVSNLLRVASPSNESLSGVDVIRQRENRNIRPHQINSSSTSSPFGFHSTFQSKMSYSQEATQTRKHSPERAILLETTARVTSCLPKNRLDLYEPTTSQLRSPVRRLIQPVFPLKDDLVEGSGWNAFATKSKPPKNNIGWADELIGSERFDSDEDLHDTDALYEDSGAILRGSQRREAKILPSRGIL